MAIRFLWQNYHPDATVTASSASADWPISFLQNRWPTLVHRTTGVSAEWWKWDLGMAQTIKYFVFWNHNFTSGATLTLQANSEDSWGAPPYSASVTWRAEKLIHYPDQNYKWWRLVVANAGNPDGYLKGGYTYLGSYFEPTYNYQNKRKELIDPSIVSLSSEGQVAIADRTKYKALVYDFAAVTDSDKSTLEAIWGTLGLGEPWFLIESSSAPENVLYVRNIASWVFEPVKQNISTFSLSVETVR